MRILFIAGFGPIIRDLDASRNLYGKALGISFKQEEGGYLHTEALNGARSFALWQLSQAAESCFGSSFVRAATWRFIFAVLIFSTAGLLSAHPVRLSWGRIASHWRPVFSSHLLSEVILCVVWGPI